MWCGVVCGHVVASFFLPILLIKSETQTAFTPSDTAAALLFVLLRRHNFTRRRFPHSEAAAGVRHRARQ